MNAVDRAVLLVKKENLAVLKKRPKNTFTSSEYAKRVGLHPTSCLEHIRKLIQLGKLKKIKFPQVEKSGRIATRTGYQLI